ncbi:hypothetical protein JW960_01165 [candidate division KSB1 bacterium]|nr:hypothetical protein [candidate division KSB1 bacterium]
MPFLRLSSGAFLLVYFLAQTVSAAINIQVFSKDEGYYESNISKPRVYIQNLANSEPITNFFAYYYFTIENNKVPVLEDYYTPVSNISLEDLGDGNYRVKFDYSGITLQPGQFIPNADGEVIGLHYADWSSFDKTNDVSNNRQTTFTLNYSIPVYLADGTLIFGDGIVPPSPSVPTLPQTAGNPGNFAVYSIERTDLRDRATIFAGDAGSLGTLEAGCDAVVSGDVLSQGTMFLRERAHVTGNAVSGSSITTQNNVLIDGNRHENALFVLPNIPSQEVVPGTQNITVSPGGSYTLSPGSYADFQAYAQSTITINPGNYTFRKFLIEPDVQLTILASSGQTIRIQVKVSLRFGDRTIMNFPAEKPYSINIYSAQTEQLFIGTDAVLYGLISAPNAEIHLYSRSRLKGSLFGKQVVVEPDAIVCKPPVLTDLFHSEWSMSPAFDPLILEFTTVVPDATSTILVTPVVQGQSVSVDGHSPDIPVDITSAEQKIIMLLTHPEACGTTEYALNVKKEGQHQIYVNDDSPCSAGSEDGNSWATAYKDLQPAIDRAAAQGREIWIAEGVYKPTRKVVTSDPRSVTFMIQSGTEIIGGFLGTETEKKPGGSPYNTILSGDIAGNDDGITTWPPDAGQIALLSDNAYHVVTITSPAPSRGIRLENLFIEHGAANGIGENAIGGGIYNKNCSPSLEMCGIQKNLSASSGAGIYDNSGIYSLTNCLIRDNVSLSGSGAGLYVNSTKTMKIDASVFDGNSCKDTAEFSGGGALYNTGAAISIVNSVFTRDTVAGSGGGISTYGNVLSLINCTFSNNFAEKGGSAISATSSAQVPVVNTILWDPGAQAELKGMSFDISYSCLRGGSGGSNNIFDNPLFSNPLQPEGSDGKWGSIDDGLSLLPTSPCIDKGNIAVSPLIDIMLNDRPTGMGFELGAYEFTNQADNINQPFGRIKNGEFIGLDGLERIMEIIHESEFNQYSKSNYHRILRIHINKNKYTIKHSEMTIFLTPLNPDGSAAATEIAIRLKKIGEDSGGLIFQSFTPDYSWGKKLIFTGDRYWHAFENPWAYVIYLPANAEINYRVPNDQFN